MSRALVSVTIRRPGCAQICGIAHAQMGGYVTLMEPAEFEQRLVERSQEVQEAGPASSAADMVD